MESLIGFNNIIAANCHINEPNPKLLLSNSIKFGIKSGNDVNMMHFCCHKPCNSIKISQSRVLSPAKHVNYCLPHSNSEEVLTTENTKSVRIKFLLEKECQFGDHILFVGDDPILGLWNPSDAIPFNWTEGNIWTLELDLPVKKSIKYKLLLKKSCGEILWQPGENRVFQLWETENVITVSEEWENAEAQKISEANEEVLPNDPKENVLAKESTTRQINSNKSIPNEDNEACSKQISSSNSTATNKGRNFEDVVKNEDEGHVLLPGLKLPNMASNNVEGV